MKKANSIVRTRTITKTNKELKDYYLIELMPYWVYVDKSQYKYNELDFHLLPYKWYNINVLWEVPSYFFLFKILRKSPSKISKKTHKRMSITVLIIEILSITKATIEFIKFII